MKQEQIQRRPQRRGGEPEPDIEIITEVLDHAARGSKAADDILAKIDRETKS